jgi:hypothetical protein
MAKKRKPEEIVAKPRQVDVLTSQGSSCRDAPANRAGIAGRPAAGIDLG